MPPVVMADVSVTVPGVGAACAVPALKKAVSLLELFQAT
jgi:hypothetical protein